MTISTSAHKTKKQVVEPVVIPSDAEAEVSELELEYEHYFSMADSMLRSIVAEKRNPNFAESTFFRGRCGWDDREQQLQVNRMSNILRFKPVAGTSAERQAAIDEQVKASEILRDEGPKIQDAIRKLSEQFDGLERNATRSERVCEQIGLAVESLRNVDVLRSDLRARHEGLRRQFAESDWTRLCSIGVEIRFREQMLAPVEDQRKFIESLGIHYPNCRKYDVASQRYVVETDVWEQRKKVMRIELVEFQDEFDRLTALKSKQLASLEPILNFYLEEK